MAKKKLTPRQREWETEYKKLRRRVRDWKRKFHAVPDMPVKPERITKKDIERLKQFKWKNISEAEKKQWRKEYEYRYENKMPEVYQPKPPYTPPTEQEFLDNLSLDELEHEKQFLEPDSDEPDEDGYTETVVSRDEIEAWIDANIYSISSDRENEGVKELLENLVLEAADACGDYEGYLNHLEANADRLNKLAQKAVKYRRRGSPEKQEEQSAVSEFATILNLGRPLTTSQAERLENEGWVSYDFND